MRVHIRGKVHIVEVHMVKVHIGREWRVGFWRKYVVRGYRMVKVHMARKCHSV